MCSILSPACTPARTPARKPAALATELLHGQLAVRMEYMLVKDSTKEKSSRKDARRLHLKRAAVYRVMRVHARKVHVHSRTPQALAEKMYFSVNP